jgi:hypothetical protein
MTEQPADARPEPEARADATPKSRLQKLIAKHPQLVASVVVGVAGLIATSIWQYRQQQTQKEQAAAAEKVAETQAANSWKIERTEVLGKNLATLAQSGPGTADQRYGVLLSLVRAEIIDPELAVSYALELGKDNPEYMLSVLQNTPNKDYRRIAGAYIVSCDARYGVSPPIDACSDKLAPRSDMLAVLASDDLANALAGDQPGPLALVKDERHVQLHVEQLVGLFELALLGMYDRRQWDELAKFEQTSQGARLVGSLVLAAARTGELATDDDVKSLEQFHATQTKWLSEYLVSKSCDAECKGHVIDVMVTRFSESQGDFDTAMRKLIESPRAQSAVAIARLHERLLWCQVEDHDLSALRDHVLVPAIDELGKAADVSTRDAILSLLALVPEPSANDTPAATAWTAMLGTLDREGTTGKSFRDHRAAASKQRNAPPTALRRVSFCNLPAATPPDVSSSFDAPPRSATSPAPAAAPHNAAVAPPSAVAAPPATVGSHAGVAGPTRDPLFDSRR